MPRKAFHRAIATNPGKHGPRDWRVTFGKSFAPEHCELIFVLGMVLIAEDRYDLPGQLGRWQLWYFVDRLMFAKTPAAVIAVAEDCHDAVVDPSTLIKAGHIPRHVQPYWKGQEA